MSESRNKLYLKRDEKARLLHVYNTYLYNYQPSQEIKSIELNEKYIILEKRAEWRTVGEDIIEITPAMLDVFQQLNTNSTYENSTSEKLNEFLELVKSKDFLFPPPSVKLIKDAKPGLPLLSCIEVGVQKKGLALLSSLHPRLHQRSFFKTLVSKSHFDRQVLRLIHNMAVSDVKSKAQGGQVGEKIAQLAKECFPNRRSNVFLETNVNYDHIEGYLWLKMNYYYLSEDNIEFTTLTKEVSDFFCRIRRSYAKEETWFVSRGGVLCASKPGYNEVAYFLMSFPSLSACEILIKELEQLRKALKPLRKALEPLGMDHIFDLSREILRKR